MCVPVFANVCSTQSLDNYPTGETGFGEDHEKEFVEIGYLHFAGATWSGEQCLHYQI